MMKDRDVAWLGERFPKLVASPHGLSGEVTVNAAYDEASGQFQILYDDEPNLIGGLMLSGAFAIRIEERTVHTTSILPALFVVGLDANPNRHLGPDGSACLCSPFIEKQYLTPDLNFTRFFEQLVIPFLYGQLFYEQEKRWPWHDYAHGPTGLLESYESAADRNTVLESIRVIQHDSPGWVTIRAMLKQRKDVGASSPCTCKKRLRIGHCHPDAMRGLNRIRADVRRYGINL